jgi:predicted transcriptional regulator
MASKTDNFTLRLTPELKARLQAIADREEDRSIGWVIKKCIDHYLPVLEGSTTQTAHYSMNERKRRAK